MLTLLKPCKQFWTQQETWSNTKLNHEKWEERKQQKYRTTGISFQTKQEGHAWAPTQKRLVTHVDYVGLYRPHKNKRNKANIHQHMSMTNAA